MSNQTIEEQITQGRALWIDDILYDPEARTVVVKFVSDPESGIIDRKLIFENVKDHAESIDIEPDSGSLGDFIGLREEPCGSFVLFTLATGDKDVSFSADPAPAIKWARAPSSESAVERSKRHTYSRRIGPDGKTTWAHETGERIKTNDDDGRVMLFKKPWVRVSAAVLAAALGAVAFWYAGNRITSPRNAIQIRGLNVDHGNGLGQSVSELRIGTFNIAHGRGTVSSNWQGGDEAERLARLKDIAQLVKERQLDVIVLNEVDFSTWWSDHFNQAEFIANAADFPYRVEHRNIDVATPLFRFRFGNAVLSKYPIMEASLIEFPAYSTLESVLAGKKNGVLCKIQVSERQAIGVAAIHLDDRSESIRVESVKRIMRRCEACDYPVFLAGDFNSSLKGFPHAEADDSGNSALSIISEGKQWRTLPGKEPRKDEFTYPTSDPRVVIDWVLVPLNWSIISKEIPLVNLSDHLPVFVQANLNHAP